MTFANKNQKRKRRCACGLLPRISDKPRRIHWNIAHERGAAYQDHCPLSRNAGKTGAVWRLCGKIPCWICRTVHRETELSHRAKAEIDRRHRADDSWRLRGKKKKRSAAAKARLRACLSASLLCFHWKYRSHVLLNMRTLFCSHLFKAPSGTPRRAAYSLCVIPRCFRLSRICRPCPS